MTAPTLGVVAGKPLAVDVERLVSTRALLTANSGGGKSWALRRMLEQTHGSIQQLVIDPEGEFYTLREKFDYVLAGRGGDCPAHPRSAALLARRLLELGTSAVLDLYELVPRDRVLFVKTFLESLIDAPRDLWHPVLVVLDEAHQYAPEKGHGEAASSEAVGRLMAQGRKRGFAGILATQRLSKLAKDVAAEANNLLVGRASLDVDLKRAGDILGLAKSDWHRIRSLEAGHFFAVGPALSGAVVELAVGTVQTSHPRAGQRAAPPPPPREKVQKILAKLAELPKEAEAELTSLQAAMDRIRQLERELRETKKAQPAPPAPKVETKTVEKFVFRAGELARFEKAVDRLDGYGKAIAAIAGSMAGRVFAAQTLTKAQAGDSASRDLVQTVRSIPARLAARPSPVSPPQTRSENARDGAPEIGRSGLRRILIALAQRPGLTNRQIGIRAGMSSQSGTFSTYLSKARVNGWIRDEGDRRFITDAGLDALGHYDPLPTGEALLEHWLGELGNSGAARILRALAEAFPDPLTNAELGERAGISHESGTFSTYLSKLRGLELVSSAGRPLRASEELFG